MFEFFIALFGGLFFGEIHNEKTEAKRAQSNFEDAMAIRNARRIEFERKVIDKELEADLSKKFLIFLCILLVLSLAGCQYEGAQTSDIKYSVNPNGQLEDGSTPETSISKLDTMIDQFESLGLTNDEAKAAEEVFRKVGINKISNISWVRGSNTDGEQQFVCRLYDYNPNIDCIKVAFVLFKQTVQRISICYSPYGKLGEYPDSNKYEELKLLNGMTKDNKSSSITLYYKMLTNNEVDKNSNGYRAIYDYETHSITKIS